jgi:hypothetical protein
MAPRDSLVGDLIGTTTRQSTTVLLVEAADLDRDVRMEKRIQA